MGLIKAAPAPDNLNAFLAFVFYAEELCFFFFSNQLGSDEDKNVPKIITIVALALVMKVVILEVILMSTCKCFQMLINVELGLILCKTCVCVSRLSR